MAESSLTDWIMVGITFVYMLFTIGIFIANIRSSESAKSQLEETKKQMEESKNQFEHQLIETKRQYEDKKRLEIMPYIQFEQTNDRANLELNLALDSEKNPTGTYILLIRMKNTGNGTAKDIAYTYQWDNGRYSYNRGAFPVQALSSGESHTIKINFSHSTEAKDDREAIFFMRYRDLLENDYTQNLCVRFSQNRSATLKLVELSTSSPAFEPKEDTNA